MPSRSPRSRARFIARWILSRSDFSTSTSKTRCKPPLRSRPREIRDEGKAASANRWYHATGRPSVSSPVGASLFHWAGSPKKVGIVNATEKRNAHMVKKNLTHHISGKPPKKPWPFSIARCSSDSANVQTIGRYSTKIDGRLATSEQTFRAKKKTRWLCLPSGRWIQTLDKRVISALLLCSL